MQRHVLAALAAGALLVGGCAGLERPSGAAAKLPSPAATLSAWRPVRPALFSRGKRRTPELAQEERALADDE